MIDLEYAILLYIDNNISKKDIKEHGIEIWSQMVGHIIEVFADGKNGKIKKEKK